MPRTASELDKCEVSPIRMDSKHHATPQRCKRKTSRRDQGIDVHNSSCSTPNSQSPRVANQIFSSPTSSFPYSQDNCPDVIWDYTSPKLLKGTRRREIKLTVQELLENLNNCQVPECSQNAQPAQYIKLLENWMSKQNADTSLKKTVKMKKGIKKRPRHVIEELKKFIETIPRLNKETESGNNSRLSNTSTSEQEADHSGNTSKLNISAKVFLGGDSTDNDSTEELWGDIDNSFIVKATQELESVSTVCTKGNQDREDLLSTIPETALSPGLEEERHSCGNRLTLDEYNDFLEQLTDIDWDSDLEEWDNGFLIGEDELSQIPEEVLSGSVPSSNAKTTVLPNRSLNSVESTVKQGSVCTSTTKFERKEKNTPKKGISSNSTRHEVGKNTAKQGTVSTKTVKCQIEVKTVKQDTMPVNTVKCHASERNTVKQSTVKCQVQEGNKGSVCTSTVNNQVENSKTSSLDIVQDGTAVQKCNTELYNSFEDESFEDESLLCQPDVLSRIDEVESLMSQLPKCTPEEIKKKKEEAIKRRQTNKPLKRLR